MLGCGKGGTIFAVVPVLGTGFTTRWTVSGDATARTITLPLNNGNGSAFSCTVNWGDGSADSMITAYNDAARIHTYASNGTYNVEIKGTCEGWSFNNAGDKTKIVAVVDWGTSGVFGGFKYLTGGFYGCSIAALPVTGGILSAGSSLVDLSRCFSDCYSITTLPADLFRFASACITFGSCFYNGLGLTTLPADLFRYNTAATNWGNTFFGCSGLTTLPAGLFQYNTAAYIFGGTFTNCSGLTAIPTDFFRYNTAVSTFGYCFFNCQSVASIPTDLFRYNTVATDFGVCFQQCYALTSIPTDLFRYNTLAFNFGSAFAACTSLTVVPADLFRYNTNASDFSYTFYGCTVLASVPADLFRYNLGVYSGGIAHGFVGVFQGCTKLQLHASIFFGAGEESTRFLNITVSFQDAFNRTSFTGTQGVAPDLWACNFGTGTPTKTTCFGGAGNSETSLSNYASIPIAWGGPA